MSECGARAVDFRYILTACFSVLDFWATAKQRVTAYDNGKETTGSEEDGQAPPPLRSSVSPVFTAFGVETGSL